MNVLILTDHLWPEGSGGELATYLYARLLANLSVQVKIVVPSCVDSFFCQDGFPVYQIRLKHFGKYVVGGSLPAFRMLKQLIGWSDIVYCAGLFAFVPYIKNRFKKPVVIHLHSTFPACPIGASYNLTCNCACDLNKKFLSCMNCVFFYEKFNNDKTNSQALVSSILNSTVGSVYREAMKSADAVLFVSQSQKQAVLNRLPEFAGKFKVIYNPVPELTQIPLKGQDLGYFGGLSLLKGFNTLMSSWCQIQESHNSQLHVSLAEKLLQQKNCFKEKKIVLYPKLKGASYSEVYGLVGAVLVPSVVPEAFPYVVTEACLRGRLVIASNVGGIPEQVAGLKGARLVEPCDSKGLTDALEWVLAMAKPSLAELGVSNREAFSRKYNNYSSVSDLIDVFQKIWGV